MIMDTFFPIWPATIWLKYHFLCRWKWLLSWKTLRFTFFLLHNIWLKLEIKNLIPIPTACHLHRGNSHSEWHAWQYGLVTEFCSASMANRNLNIQYWYSLLMFGGLGVADCMLYPHEGWQTVKDDPKSIFQIYLYTMIYIIIIFETVMVHSELCQ